MKKRYLIYDIGVGYYTGSLGVGRSFSTDIEDAIMYDELFQAELFLFDEEYSHVFNGRLLEVKVFYTDN